MIFRVLINGWKGEHLTNTLTQGLTLQGKHVSTLFIGGEKRKGLFKKNAIPFANKLSIQSINSGYTTIPNNFGLFLFYVVF
jgi:hypothetical protein